MKTKKWNDGLSPRSRKSFALLVSAHGGILPFTGQSISQWCQVTRETPSQNGKWSNTQYEVALHESTILVAFRQDFESGRSFPQGTWADALVWLQEEVTEEARRDGVPAPQVAPGEFEAYLRANFPKTSTRFDEAAEGLATLSAAPPPPAAKEVSSAMAAALRKAGLA